MELQIKIPRPSKLHSLMCRYYEYSNSYSRRKNKHADRVIQHCHWLVAKHLKQHNIDWRAWNIATSFFPRNSMINYITKGK